MGCSDCGLGISGRRRKKRIFSSAEIITLVDYADVEPRPSLTGEHRRAKADGEVSNSEEDESF